MSQNEIANRIARFFENLPVSYDLQPKAAARAEVTSVTKIHSYLYM